MGEVDEEQASVCPSVGELPSEIQGRGAFRPSCPPELVGWVVRGAALAGQMTTGENTSYAVRVFSPGDFQPRWC